MNGSENKIDEILSSLDGIQRAGARPFMYTRVMARMQSEDRTVWGRVVSYIARPAVALACMIAVIATNAYFITKTEKQEEEAAAISATSAVEDYWQNENFVLAVNNPETNE